MNWKRKSEGNWGRLVMKCKLEEIVDVTMGQSPKSEYYNTEKNGILFYKETEHLDLSILLLIRIQR